MLRDLRIPGQGPSGALGAPSDILFRTQLSPLVILVGACWSVKDGGGGYGLASTSRITNAEYWAVDLGAISGRKCFTIEG